MPTRPTSTDAQAAELNNAAVLAMVAAEALRNLERALEQPTLEPIRANAYERVQAAGTLCRAIESDALARIEDLLQA